MIPNIFDPTTLRCRVTGDLLPFTMARLAMTVYGLSQRDLMKPLDLALCSTWLNEYLPAMEAYDRTLEELRAEAFPLESSCD